MQCTPFLAVIAAAGACLGLSVPTALAQAPGTVEVGTSGVSIEYEQKLGEGVLNNSLGRHRLAENAFSDALALCEARFGVNAADCVDVTMRLALELSNQERYEESGLLFQRAEKLVRGSRSPLDQPRLTTYRAVDLANRGQFEAAMELVADANQKRKALLKATFRKARSAEPEAKAELARMMTELAHGLYVQASVAFRLGRLDEATVTAHLVRQLVGKAADVPAWWIAFADALLADIELRKGNFKEAEKRLRLALKAKQVALGNTRAVALTHMALGAVFRETSRNAEAVESSRPGLEILRGELRQAPGVAVERLEPFLQAAYTMAGSDPSRRQTLHAEMFSAAQLAQSSRTAGTVARMAARFASDRPEIADLVQNLQFKTRLRDELRITLGRAAIGAAGSGDTAQVESLKRSYANAAEAVAVLETQLRTAFPSYANLVNPAPSSVDQVADLLLPDEALLYYLMGEEASYVFIVRQTGVTATVLNLKQSEAADMIRRLRAPFEKPGTRIAPYDLGLAHRLYRALLGPVETALAGAGHLIVVSSHELLSLPFALLVTNPPADDEDRYRKAGWLIRDHAISQMPSVRSFASFRANVRPSKASLPFIGFGNPVFEGARSGGGIDALTGHCQLGAPVPPSLLRQLSALPDTEEEVRRVAHALGADNDSVVLGGAVTESRVRNMALDRYRVVYFATHGLLPGELRCQSQPGLALTPPMTAVGDRAQDGLLEASEIAGLKLDADLVVLSACNTGGGGSGKLGGESLSGLVRAFFQAGTRSILVSHWQVDTVATMRLMTRTFGHLAQGQGMHVAEAVRHSQMDLIGSAETAHPFFWAAFTLVGDGQRKEQIPVAGLRKQLGYKVD